MQLIQIKQRLTIFTIAIHWPKPWDVWCSTQSQILFSWILQSNQEDKHWKKKITFIPKDLGFVLPENCQRKDGPALKLILKIRSLLLEADTEENTASSGRRIWAPTGFCDHHSAGSPHWIESNQKPRWEVRRPRPRASRIDYAFRKDEGPGASVLVLPRPPPAPPPPPTHTL